MSYSSMSHQSAGYVVTASNYNQFTDNDAACAVAAYTTKGDLFPATGSLTGARLAAGTDYYGLHADSAQSSGLLWMPDPYGVEHVTAKTEFSNSSAEQTLWSKSVTWSLYSGSSNRMLHLHALISSFNNTGGNVVLTYKFKYGATVVTFQNITEGSVATYYYPSPLHAYVVGNGATNAQWAMGFINGSFASSSAVYTGTVDSTAAVTVSLTCTMDTANANAKNNILFSRLEGYAV
jgi:hypothetical protein